MNNSALGLIEVEGYLGIIAAADTALKAADVKIVQLEKISGGMSTLQISGDVGAVSAAVDAAKETILNLGCHRSTHVIPRVDDTVLKMSQGKKVKQLEKAVVAEDIKDSTNKK